MQSDNNSPSIPNPITPQRRNPNLQAVVYSDLRLDDKVGLYVLSQSNRYSRINIVITAVSNLKGGYHDLAAFFASLKHPLPFPGSLFRVIGGSNIFGEVQPQERLFQRLNPSESEDALPPLIGFRDWLAAVSVEGNTTPLEIFQIGPTPAEDLKLLINAEGIDIKLYYLLHGWNSYQLPNPHTTNNCATQPDEILASKLAWLISLRSTIRSHHPKALVLFSSNLQSFDPPSSGDYAPLSQFKGVIPERFLEAVLHDGHYPWIFQSFHQLLQKHRVELELLPEKSGESEFSDLLLEARKHQTPRSTLLRRHFLDFIETGLHQLDDTFSLKSDNSTPPLSLEDKDVLYRIKFLGKDAVSKPVGVQICDGIHILAVLDRLDPLLDMPHKAMFFKVYSFKFVETDSGIEFGCLKQGAVGEEEDHGLALIGMDAEPLKERISRLLW